MDYHLRSALVSSSVVVPAFLVDQSQSPMPDREAVDRIASRTDVSASEVANYTFCAKAWHLEHVLGAAPSVAAEQRRLTGVEAHAKHGADIQAANRVSAWLVRGLVAVLLVAVAILLVGLVLSWH